MNFLAQPSARRIISSVVSLLCVLLAPVKMQKGMSTLLSKMKPSVELQASRTVVTYPCSLGFHSVSRSCPTGFDLQVNLTAIATGFNRRSVYVYTVTGGRVIGEGDKVTWDLSEAGPAYHTATVEVHDNNKHRALSTVKVTVQNCADCVDEWPCPTIDVVCYDQVKVGTPITCKVVVGASSRSNPNSYEWSALDSNGDASDRISGRGTNISVRTEGLGGQTVYTKVKVQGLDPSCSATASGSAVVKP